MAAAILLALLVLMFCALAMEAGRQSLPQHPRAAVTLMNYWFLAQSLMAALGAAAVIIVSLEVALPESVGAENGAELKKVVSSLATAMTAFITAMLITSGKDADAALGERVRQVFQSSYRRPPDNDDREEGVHYFRAGSRGEQLAHGNGIVTGWSREARAKRARELEKELASGASDA